MHAKKADSIIFGYVAADKARLPGIYLQSEQYLTKKEPIRTFTREELRAKITPDLLQRLSAYESKDKK
jgi:hypothetical protein